MKKILFLAAACAALAACNVSDLEKDSPEINGNAFVKGQKVVLKVNAGTDTKAAGTLDGYDIGFTWSTGDEILVTVEGQGSATFTLKGEGGSASGEFEGEMPGSGTTFSAQYPATEPNLTTQTYDPSHAIASGLMKATATGCAIGSPIELTPAYAVLRLNLYGIERKVSQIVITNTTSKASPKPSYTLSISPAVTVSSDKNTPTPFFIVVPAGASAWNFKTEVTSEASVTPSTYVLPKYPSNAESNYGSGILVANVYFNTTSAKTFAAGKIRNMAAVSLTTVWAPVNCGYEPKTGDSGAALGYPYGKLYQWGRKYGQGYYKAGSGSIPTYEDADYPGKSSGTQTLEKLTNTSDILTSHPDGDTYNGKFYWYQSNWYQGGGTGAPAVDEIWGASKTTYDPCPEGWRVPTASELIALMGNHTSGACQDGNHGTLTNIYGKYFDGSTATTPTSGVFLPLPGSRTPHDGYANYRDSYAYYWSSTVNLVNSARGLTFLYGRASIVYSNRANGFAVRCVQE